MNQAKAIGLLPISFEAQPRDVRGMAQDERDALIVSLIQVDGTWTVLSCYGDDRWRLTGGASNVRACNRILDFTLVPAGFRSIMKAVMYRYLRRGRAGSKRPGAARLRSFLIDTLPFLRHLDRLNLQRLGLVTPMVCSVFVHQIKSERAGRGGKPCKAETLRHYFQAVEAIHELSQYTDDPMPAKPWPETSSWILAGLSGEGSPRKQKESKTPLMPDEVFAALFQAAWGVVEKGPNLLRLRDELERLAVKRKGQERRTIIQAKKRYLDEQGWSGGMYTFSKALLELRTACYIVVASLSGCRNHELAYIQRDACYRTVDDDGEVYWWMKSRSTKTGIGHTEWMIPEAAVTALRVMDRWAETYRAQLDAEIAHRRASNPTDPKIAEAQSHLGAVFVGATRMKRKEVRTLSGGSWSAFLKAFARRHGINWDLASHQFRRKFANYAARSKFGDLRYLKDHFKHWSMDMTLGYALNESQEMALYVEIQDELDDLKDGVVEQWLRLNEPLAGGYGRGIMAWRGSKEVTLFKDQRSMVRSISDSTAIRSNGHAWCTADDNLCVGNGGLDRTRCTECDNAVIGRAHAHIYQGIYDHLQEVLKCDDIGEGGLARVRRDLGRCRDVLISLGYDPAAQAA